VPLMIVAYRLWTRAVRRRVGRWCMARQWTHLATLCLGSLAPLLDRDVPVGHWCLARRGPGRLLKPPRTSLSRPARLRLRVLPAPGRPFRQSDRHGSGSHSRSTSGSESCL